MNRMRLGMSLIAAIAAGCSSHPPRAIPPEMESPVIEQASVRSGEHFAALPQPAETLAAGPLPEQQSAAYSAPQTAAQRTPRDEYEELIVRPEAESRAVRFSLNSQTFDYTEDGEVIVTGPIASGKASSPTPTGKFSVLSKEKDKESSLYTNDIGMQAWMPYSMQFYGNYFVHEGWLPGRPASHGCIRVSHYHAKLLFERMKIGDPVIVAN